MSNIITKGGIVVYRTSDDITLPSDGIAMIEFTPNGENDLIRIGGGDINTNNSILYNNVANIPVDYKDTKYLYNGTNFTANPDYTEA